MREGKKGWIWNMAERMAAAVVICLLLAGCGSMGQKEEGAEAGAGQADYFAYVDEENNLYFWRQGEDSAVLLTDKAFAETADLEKTDDSLTKAENALPYWEEWEYWEEWDNDEGGWVWNYEKALRGTVKKAPDGVIYFPQEMEWKSFRMERSAGELEEARKYSHGEPVDEYAGVRIFLYDLYRYGGHEDGGTEGAPEKIAENVCYYSMDKKGNIWYCKAEEESGSDAGFMLCRYDGAENLEIAEINGRRKDAFRTSKNGEYVIFYSLDDSLCGCSPAGEDGTQEVLIENAGEDLFETYGIYTDENMSRMIYAGESIAFIERGKGQEIWGDGDAFMAAVIGKAGKKVLTADFEEEGFFADWVDWEKEEMDQDTKRLKELMEKYSARSESYLSLCHVNIMDLMSQEKKLSGDGDMEDEKEIFRGREIQSMDGYLMSWPTADGISIPREVYYIEMIPEKPFEKFTLQELLGDDTPADVLWYYEKLREDEYYLETYGDEYEEHAFSDALRSSISWETLEGRSCFYAVTAEGIQRIEEVENKGWILNEDYNENGDVLYFSVYWDADSDESGQGIGYYQYGFLEDRYRLDKEGNCVKVAEAADGTAVSGGEVFYSRIIGLDGMVRLYRSSASGCIAEAVSISLESIKKSSCSEAVLFLADGLAETENEDGVYVETEKDLRKAYYDLSDGRSWYETGHRYGEEITERTLVMDDGSGAKKLGEDILQYGFYGTDNVWMLQYEDREETESGEEEETNGWEDWSEEESGRKGGSRLYVYENGEKRQIAERAVWMVPPACIKAAGYEETDVSWVYE